MSLLLDVSGLEREVGREIRFKLRGPAPTGALPEGVTFGPLIAEGRAIWTGDGVLAEGTTKVEAELVCSRCLKPFRSSIAAPFAREYRPLDGGARPAGARERGERRAEGQTRRGPAWEPVAPEDVPASTEGEEPLPIKDETVDLTFPAWEALVLELPMKPVCRERCRGLCPVCGADRNQTTCGCEAEKADPRLLSLRKLLDAKERGEK